MYHSAPGDVMTLFFFFLFSDLFVERRNKFGSKPSVGDRNIKLAKQKKRPYLMLVSDDVFTQTLYLFYF